jgi:hypothetical protein
MAEIRKVDPSTVLTPRQRFRQIIEDLLAEHPEMSTADLADLVATTLPTEDAELVEAFLAAEARQILAWEVRAHVAQNRGQIMHVIDIHGRNQAPPLKQRSEKVRATLYDRIEAWREYVPSENQSRPLLDMTRRDLLESADFDLGRAFTFGFKHLLKRRLAEGMPDDNTPAHAVYSTEQVADLAERIKEEMSRGNFRLKLAPFQSLPGAPSVPRQADGRNSAKPRDR